MKVWRLIEELQHMPQDAEVVAQSRDSLIDEIELVALSIDETVKKVFGEAVVILR